MPAGGAHTYATPAGALLACCRSETGAFGARLEDAQPELSTRRALDTVIRVRYAINEKEVTFRVLDDGAVIVHFETGYYYTLNATGTFLWELLSEGERTREELVAELARVFEQDEAAVAADVQRHLDDLQRENLVVVR